MLSNRFFLNIFSEDVIRAVFKFNWKRPGGSKCQTCKYSDEKVEYCYVMKIPAQMEWGFWQYGYFEMVIYMNYNLSFKR